MHVCQRWRSVVFASPCRLYLRLVCTDKTPARSTLDVWPALPIVIQCHGDYRTESVDNFIAVLERNDRVEEIELFDVGLHLDKVLAAMQVPLPALEDLTLRSDDGTVVLPDSFLGGYAPYLEFLELNGISFPGLPTLLLSATLLVDLRLFNIPDSGYIPPDTMVTALSALTSLESLFFEFQSPLSYPYWERRPRPPLTRTVLPVLTTLGLKGVTEYLEDLVTCIDTPRLNNLQVTSVDQIAFDTPQLVQFICRTPRLKTLEKARVTFEGGTAAVNLWQLSSLDHLYTSSWPSLTTLEDIYIYEAPYWQPHLQNNIENTQWLELLHPFTSVESLYLSEGFAPHIVPALQELVWGRMAEVLPALRNIFLEGLEPTGPVQKAIEQFVSARLEIGRASCRERV